MYSRKEHAERLVLKFGFECSACRAEVARSIDSPTTGVVCVARRDDGLYAIEATTSSPADFIREISSTTKRQHTLVHSMAVLDAKALEGQLHRHLEGFLDSRRRWYEPPPAIVDKVCAARHFCEVPSPYRSGAAASSAFDTYIKAVERAALASVS